MSIERFRETYPAEPRLKELVSKRKESLGLPGSDVSVLAFVLAQEGGDGLRELTKELGLINNNPVALDGDSLRRMSLGQRKRLFDNYAMVVFGISVVCLEDALVNKEFDPSQWASYYDFVTSGSNFPSPITRPGKIEILSYGQWQAMKLIVNKDKTFSAFFNADGMKAIPESLARILERSGALGNIDKTVMPMYQERARFVVSQETSVVGRKQAT